LVSRPRATRDLPFSPLPDAASCPKTAVGFCVGPSGFVNARRRHESDPYRTTRGGNLRPPWGWEGNVEIGAWELLVLLVAFTLPMATGLWLLRR